MYFYSGDCVFDWKILEKPWEVCPFEYYPDFCKGPGYLLSWDLLQCVNAKVNDKNEFFPFYVEDVSTGIYVEKCNGTAYDTHRYPELDVFNAKKDRHKFASRYVYHHVTEKSQFDMFWDWEDDKNKKYS